jgi:flagellar basal body-associated protein FliL
MAKGSLFSDREWSEISQGYRRASWAGRARIWFYVSLAVLIATATVLSIIWVVGAAITPKAQPLAETAAPVAHAPPSQVGSFDYEVDNLNVTFGNAHHTRIAYAQFSLVVQCADAECLSWMKLNRASIRDAVFTVATRTNYEDFKNTAAGVETFKKAVLEEMKLRFRPHAPKSLLIRDWFMR